MNFKIISVGWNCPDVFEQTLKSVQLQENPNWQAHIVDDGSPDPRMQQKIETWLDTHDERWMATFHTENRGAVRNQYEGIRAMEPDDEDVIVFLDLDGDQLAHEQVLDRLEHYYQQDILMTYGSYEPVPAERDFICPVSPYPDLVVRDNTYRQATMLLGTRYNHLRTAKWKLLKHIPEEHFHFPNGEWIFSPADLIVMMGCLELAGGRYKCIPETLLLYNAAQPYPDHTRNPDRNVLGSNVTFDRTPLRPLPRS